LGVGLGVGLGLERLWPACDAARAVVLVVHVLVITGQRVGAPREQRRAKPVVDGGGRVVVGTHAVGAPAVGAVAIRGVGALIEVESG